VTTVHYLIERFAGSERASRAIDWILRAFDVLPADRESFLRAQSLGLPDFEDAVVASCAEAAGCDRIVTRNVADFTSSPVRASTPTELLAELAAVDDLE
jgi:hypothetical protein